ncbi:MAG: glycosyl hydrolase [Muribaculaceae bacterium]|nr:glycosyl hydrolase [Muribaculaceae bacterium]
MKNRLIHILFAIAVLLSTGLTVGAKSAKRGICWDESNMPLGEVHASLLSPGVSWVYNWGPDAASPSLYDADFRFEPMAWNGAYDAGRMRRWYAAHPDAKYLLAFNEPNFADQARMTPVDAAKAWPGIEAIAEEFGLKIVAPALNFPPSQVGGRVWSPYEWYDEFFRLMPDAKVWCLAMHSYMNWYGANTWLATEYFYADLYNPAKDCYGRYPSLVSFLDRFKAANGHFPRMMLTEFCSWENDGTITGVDFQIDQMTQKVQRLEQSELVEGYAWFLANPLGGAAEYPYMSLLQTCTPSSTLSELGQVYVNMSDFDTSRYYKPGERIAAKDYVDATTDGQQIRLRVNTDAASEQPLQVEIPAGAYPVYKIELPATAAYTLRCRVRADASTRLALYVDSRKVSELAVEATPTVWKQIELTADLAAGRHDIMLYNAGGSALLINEFALDGTDGIAAPEVGTAAAEDVYTISGLRLASDPAELSAGGVYFVRSADGSVSKIIK